MDVLQGLRSKIDSLDDQIVHLLQERAATAITIGQVKEKHAIAVLDSGREERLLNRLMQKSAEQPLSGEAVRTIYSNIIQACRAVQVHKESVDWRCEPF